MIVLCVMAFILLITLGVMFSFSHRVLKKEAVNGAWQTLDVTGNHGVGSSDHIILKNVLTVDASKHHMVDACSALFPYLSGHIISGNIA
jgi:hypothetical protein